MQDFILQIFPDFPGDRDVVTTMDWSRFFKIDYNKRTLYVPTQKALRGNLSLVDKFTDAVEAFMYADLTNPVDWSNTTYETDKGAELIALHLIDLIEGDFEREIEGNPDRILACDIETKGLGWKGNKLLAIGFCADGFHARIISIFTEAVRRRLQQLFKRTREKIRFTWHNGKFDTGRMEYMNKIRARVDEDTMLMHYIGINEHKGTHGLKDLGALYLQAPDWDSELDDIKKEYCRAHKITLKEFTYDLIPPEVLHKYLHFDVVATFRLYYVLKPLMRPRSRNMYYKLIEASNAYRNLEVLGAKIDVDYLFDLEYQLEELIEEANQKVEEVTSEIWDPMRYARETGAKATPKTKFNYKSPKQLKWLLETATGRKLQSTDKKALEELFLEVGDQYPIVNALKELRKYSKYMDTYVQGFRDLLAPDGRIHGTYNLHGTETGRLSSSDPNMQNIPRDKTIKNLIVAEDGYKFVQLDYSQAELRVLAYLSKDEFLTGVYVRDEDLHAAVATSMFGPDFTKEQRVQAKTINFGIAYGRGPKSLQDTFKIPFSEAQDLINNWFSQMPKVKKWISEQRGLVYKNITPETPLGRQRHFVVTYEGLNHIQNEYVNFPIQSIASDMTLLSLCELTRWIQANNLEDEVRIVLNVHDSIVLEVLDNQELIDRVAAEAIQVMSDIPREYLEDLQLPFKADAEVGYSWGCMSEWVPPEEREKGE